MPNPRILAGAIVRQDPAVLKAHLKTLTWQNVKADIDFCFVDDGDHEAILKEYGSVLKADPRPEGAVYSVGPQTHQWSVETFYHLASQKNRLLQKMLDEGYDYLWLCDTDLLCDKTTLRSLLSLKAPIANAVFWTHWQATAPSAMPLPQVWLQHPYGLEGLGLKQQDFLRKLQRRETLRVLGGGACTLIHRTALERGLTYEPIAGLPTFGMWQGEDRHFAVRAERLHLQQYADGWPDVFHAYHPAQRGTEVLDSALDALGQQFDSVPNYGDLISVVVEPLQHPNLQKALAPEHRSIRGRFGAIPFAPEIEVALEEMKPEESRIVSVSFPQTWPFSEYAGQTKLLQVTLVDVKPYSAQPVLADHVFRGVV